MRSLDADGEPHVSFISGTSKVAPKCATSIPRLELCAAMEAAKCATSIISELNRKPEAVFLHSDSRIVLDYISNSKRRFSKYVERRIAIILDHTEPEDWHYVNTQDNPADLASRPQMPLELIKSHWFTGPSFLWDPHFQNVGNCCGKQGDSFLPEERREAGHVLQSSTFTPLYNSVLSELFSRVNSFLKLINIATYILKLIRSVGKTKQSCGLQLVPCCLEVKRGEAINLLEREAQRTCLAYVVEALKTSNRVPDSWKVSQLSPYLDSQDIIRVGGRLKNANVPFSFKHPALLPKNHPLTEAILMHYHRETKHQGAHISHASIMQAGYHIESGKQVIRKFISNCVLCRKLRATTSTQIMADLPVDRVESSPPFSTVGMDVFGPFFIHDGASTRRSNPSKKIWALIFVCLPSRAIHLEVLPAMDTSTFRNALTRFVALRGTCQGSNFIGAKNQLESNDL